MNGTSDDARHAINNIRFRYDIDDVSAGMTFLFYSSVLVFVTNAKVTFGMLREECLD
jgi:hypothetical protein